MNTEPLHIPDSGNMIEESKKNICPHCQGELVGFGGDCADGSNRCMEC